MPKRDMTNIRELWTGVIVGRMHIEEISLDELAEAADMSKSYVSLILNGKRHPVDACGRLTRALNQIIDRRERAARNEAERLRKEKEREKAEAKAKREAERPESKKKQKARAIAARQAERIRLGKKPRGRPKKEREKKNEDEQ